MKKEPLIFSVCDSITKYAMYALIFLMPIFFLPWTSEVLEFNKQTLLLVLIFIASFSFMLKILVSGKAKVNKSKIHIAAGALFLVYAISTIFSVYRYGSFWGQPQQLSESMIVVICLFLFYFLVSNVFSKKEIYNSAIVLSCSAVIAQLVGILQLFGAFIMPIGITKNIAFNTIGSVGSLGLFAAILLPLAMMLLISAKKWWRALYIAQIALSAIMLVLINYTIIWWVVILGSAAVLVFGAIKKDLFDGRWMALPMFFLVISLFFVLFNPQINLLPQRPNEIFLLQKTGLDIALKTIKEKPIFGSGPGTFAYDFSKNKSPAYSNSALWSVTFNKSSSKVLNNLATIGLFGFLGLLAFLALPIFYAGRLFAGKKKSGNDEGEEKPVAQGYSVLLLGLFVVLIQVGVSFFLHDSNLVLDFVFFFAVAAIAGMIYDERKSYVLRTSSFVNLVVTFVFTLVFIFGMGLLILDGQRYIAEIRYNQGIADYQAGRTADGLKKLESAASMNPKSDMYFRQLSQAYLLALQNELKNVKADATYQQRTDIQKYMANAVNAGKIATDINPQDVNNWSIRGYVYQSLIGIQQDAQAWAINSYDAGLKLDPNNPYLFLQEGNSYLAGALSLPSEDSDKKGQMLKKAEAQLEKAVALNQSYSDAYYSLGLVYSVLDKTDESISAFRTVQQLNPSDRNIQPIIDNLEAGKPILQIAPTPASKPPATTEK